MATEFNCHPGLQNRLSQTARAAAPSAASALHELKSARAILFAHDFFRRRQRFNIGRARKNTLSIFKQRCSVF